MNNKLPLSLNELPLKGKKVLMRVDFNVPLDEKGKITDDSRIQASLPSINYVLSQGAALILMSHLGRPKGKEEKFSLKEVAKKLEELAGQKVLLASDCIGEQVEQQAKNLKACEILLLENLRFHKEEEKPNEDFVKKLASLGDFYVNDAFGTAHRSHASTALIANHFKGRCAAGFLLENEIKYLKMLLENPKRPFSALIGGAKISTKFGVLKALAQKVDFLLVGGGMAYTFLKAQGYSIGKSICDDAFLEAAKELLEISAKRGAKIILPVDCIITDKISSDAKMHVIAVEDGIPEGYEGVDLGPKTVLNFIKILKESPTIFWNGPVGVFECAPFARGTNAIAHALSEVKATTVVGGGDSLAAMQRSGKADSITHLSTGGGASLEFLEHGTLPGVEALIDNI